MSSTDKPRPDSKLKTLPEERQSDISEYAVSHTLAETVEWLGANGVETSTGSVSTFLHWYHLRKQMTANELAIEQLLTNLATQNPDITPERIFQLGQIFFSGFALAKQDPNAWSVTQRTAMTRARLDLAIKKYHDARQDLEAAQAPGGLTPETVKTHLSAFKTSAETSVYQRLPDGSAILDGYPIVWTDVLEPYGTAASQDKAIAVFGALSFWWFGEHGSPRMDTSDQVFFANDQLAVKFIEEIDFDYAATDATAALLTAAS